MTTQIQNMKCFRLDPDQVVAMQRFEEVNWSEVVRTAIDREIKRRKSKKRAK